MALQDREKGVWIATEVVEADLAVDAEVVVVGSAIEEDSVIDAEEAVGLAGGEVVVDMAVTEADTAVVTGVDETSATANVHATKPPPSPLLSQKLDFLYNRLGPGICFLCPRCTKRDAV